jgi:hypothetical protein
MNFNKLPKEKRTHLILVVVAILMVAGGLGFGLIRYQDQNLKLLAKKKAGVAAKLQQVQNAVKHTAQIEADLASSGQKLAELESDVASGDLYSWAINTIRAFKAPYKVEIPQVSPVSSPADVDLLPGFPYKQARFVLTGTAHYHDFGRFVADFENQFPHIRVLNLNLEPNASPLPDEQETVSFRMEIAALVKTNPS